MGFPCSLVGKESACKAGDLGLIPGSGRSPGEGNGSPLQYSCLENPMDKRSLAGYCQWDHKNRTWLSNYITTIIIFQWLSNKMSFPSGASVKNLPANAGDLRDVDSTPGSGRSPGEGHGNSLQFSCLENPMNRVAWQATVHRVTKRHGWSDLASKWASNTVLKLLNSSKVGYLFPKVVLKYIYAFIYAISSLVSPKTIFPRPNSNYTPKSILGQCFLLNTYSIYLFLIKESFS